ncbi:sulfite exporter TauE/SafE family protein [Streptococcus merionis]|uniref:sulfite exporter TauE/SafE family protein n=1 Tax=Streptococcus merionis TaxID=400065 RepID=UPI0026EB5047|nr:sulfite exporter TauE/SafE family protein [Streptococcus merionis]
MQVVLYTLIVFLATALGATTGAGGGAIIKPVFDLIGIDTASTIGVYSTIAVFAMCMSSIYKHAKNGVQFECGILLSLSLGSVFGGIFGELVFRQVTQIIPNSRVTLIQSILLLFVILAVTIFTQFSDRIPSLGLRNTPLLFIFGCLVGAISVFLGIGGGPLNIIVLVGLMGYTPKGSAAYSIAMIFFAQIPKIFNLVVNHTSYQFNTCLVPLIILAAIIGGNVGTLINHHFSERQVKAMYLIMMVFLLTTCATNIYRNW